MLYDDRKDKSLSYFPLLRNKDCSTELHGTRMYRKISLCPSSTGNMKIYAKHELISWLVLSSASDAMVNIK